MNRRTTAISICAAAAVAALVFTTQAKVYQTVGSFFDGAVLNAERLGRAVYSAVMQINGGKADVTVVGAREGVEAIGRSVHAAGTTSARFEGDGSFGLGIVDGGDKTLRFVALAPSHRAGALVVAVAQSKKEEKESRPDQAVHGVPDVPAYPGGTVTCFMRNADTRSSFETQRVPAASGAAASFYAGALARNGWTEFSPGRPGNRTGVRLFAKGRDICCVSVKASDWSGESVVTLLHKRGAVD